MEDYRDRPKFAINGNFYSRQVSSHEFEVIEGAMVKVQNYPGEQHSEGLGPFLALRLMDLEEIIVRLYDLKSWVADIGRSIGLFSS
jgi:hypothetical protein